ncbi:MAG: nucleotidyltransferase family protein [Candidatus Bathyarchaeia archaeon]
MICVIVLAAGSSTRFRRNKLLEKIDGSIMIERVVKSAVSSKADEVVVVLGHEAQRVKEALKNFECKFVFNKYFKKGQSYSVKAGVKSVMGYADAVMVLPGDVALITSKSINMVIEEYEKCRSLIIVASHKGQSGHPVLLDRSLFNEIMEISEETMGLKAVMNRHRDFVKKVEVGSNEVLIDIDSEEDLNKISESKNTI